VALFDLAADRSNTRHPHLFPTRRKELFAPLRPTLSLLAFYRFPQQNLSTSR